MPTIKQTKLSGLNIPSTDLEQDPSGFRDTLNVFQDADGTIYTRSGDVEYVDGNGDTVNDIQVGDFSVQKVLPYVAEDVGEDPLLFCRALIISTMPMYPTFSYTLNSDELFLWDFKTGQRRVAQSTYRPTLADSEISFTELNNVMFFSMPTATNTQSKGLFKWDGRKWHKAGLPGAAIAVSPGAQFVRCFYITVDFKANEVIGQFTQRSAAVAANLITINPTLAGNALADRSSKGLLSQGYDDKYLQVTGNPTYNSGTKELTIPSTNKNVLPGDWMIFRIFTGTWAQNVGLSDSAGFVNVGYMAAMQVKDVTSTNVIFDGDETKSFIYVDGNEWITAAAWVTKGLEQAPLNFNSWATILTSVNSTATLDTYIANVFLASYSSTLADSGYQLRDVRPIAYLAPSYTYTINVTLSITTQLNFNSIAGALFENTVDDSLVVLPFPEDIKYLSQQNGNLLAATDEIVYFNSIDLGGSQETIDGLSNLVVGSIKDGVIKGIGATESFVFVSREKRNYAVVGNIYTGNFQVQPYREPQPGTTNYKNIISVNDTVMFSNRFGLFAATASQLSPISRPINGLFTKQVFDRLGLNGTVLGPLQLLESSYDATRNLVSWKLSTSKLLTLNLNTGSFFFWSWDVATCQFINGKYWSAKPSTEGLLYVEDPLSTDTFESPLASNTTITWITLGEPSLEKQFTQIKWFVKASSNLTASVFRDWDYVNKIQSSEVYSIDPNSPLSQKHKIKSNKSLAISISIECPAGQRMQIQGYELEYNPIQEGMKR